MKVKCLLGLLCLGLVCPSVVNAQEAEFDPDYCYVEKDGTIVCEYPVDPSGIHDEHI